MDDRPREFVWVTYRMVDVRHRYPDTLPRGRPVDEIEGLSVHHDGVIMVAGDRDYSGSTLNEDLARLDAIYAHAIRQGWKRFPYHAAASPNGRTFLTLDPGHRGSHTIGKNRTHLGVVLLGNFTFNEPGNRQLCAAGLAIAASRRMTGRDLPIGAHRVLTPPDHPTACPGDTFQDWWARLVRSAAFHAAR